MPWLHENKCDRCDLAFPVGWGGCFYATRESGERVPVPHGDLKDVQEITGQTIRQAERDGRVGFASYCLCFDCLAQLDLDVQRDVKQCPKCGSLNVKTAKGSVGLTCPACRLGRFREIVVGVT